MVITTPGAIGLDGDRHVPVDTSTPLRWYEEINLALRHARALAAMDPPMEISRPLAIFIAELLAELWRRGKAEDGERQIAEFGWKELRDAFGHARSLRELRPRHGMQAGMADYMLAIMAELVSRSTAKGDRAARVIKSLADSCPVNAND